MTIQQNTTRKGSVIIFSLITMAFIIVSSLAMARVTLIDRTNVGSTNHSAVAFQTSDAGVEVYLQALLRDFGQLSSIAEVASSISGASCTDGRISFGNGAGTVEIVSYERHATDPLLAGPEIITCGAQLANVADFKVVGEFRDTARALQLRIRDSLTRNLIVHWSFEDNADAILGTQNYPGSAVAKDSANKTDEVGPLTLCPLDQDSHNHNGGSNESFDFCHHYDGDDSASDVYMDHGSDLDRGSAWGGLSVSGIVDETEEAPNPGYTVPWGQALEFNGTSNYLTLNTSESSHVNYIPDGQLTFDAAVRGISVAFWYRRDDRNADQKQVLFSKSDGTRNEGLQIFVENDRVQATYEGTELSGGSVNDTDWHHVVVTGDRDGSGVDDDLLRLYVDGERVDDSSSPFNVRTLSNEQLMIGGRYKLEDGNQPFDPSEFEDPFDGWIDDIRVYRRGLTSKEIDRLCSFADADNSDFGGCN